MIKSEAEIYEVLEELLEAAGEKPQTCVDLFEDQRVKKLADNPNRISDYLGHMWRKGVVQRWYSNDKSQRARYAYTLIQQEEKAPEQVARLTVPQRTHKPNVTITEADNSVVLDFPEFTITVVRK